MSAGDQVEVAKFILVCATELVGVFTHAKMHFLAKNKSLLSSFNLKNPPQVLCWLQL